MLESKGKYYENAIEYLTNTILNKGFPIVKIEKNSKIVGRSGVSHEIDILIKYMILNEERLAIIECKNFHKDKVKKSDILILNSLVNDIPFSHGIIISASGFQTGALDYAKSYGIETISYNESKIVLESTKNFINAVLPTDYDIAQPFYTIMEKIGSGTIETNGNYTIIEIGGKRCFLLFLSKKAALRFIQSNNYCVYSVSKRHLEIMCNLALNFRMEIAICFNNFEQEFILLNGKDVIELYIK